MAWARDSPHISGDGGRLPHTRGRPGWPKMRQPLCSSSWTQRTPAGLPFGMPGIGELIDGAVQQAPQPGRQAKDEDMVGNLEWVAAAGSASLSTRSERSATAQ